MPLSGFDVATIMFLLFLGNLTVACILAIYNSGFGQVRSYRMFMAGKIFQAAGWPLFIFRGMIPDLISVQIANSLLFAGFICETFAITNADTYHKNSEKVFGILGLICFCTIWLLMWAAPANIKVAIASVLLTLIYSACACFLFNSQKNSVLRKVLGFFFCLFSLSSIYRAGSSILSTSAEYNLLSDNASQTIEYGLFFVILFISGIGFLLLLKEQDDEILKESETFNRGLVENLPDLIVVYGHDQKILYVNSAVTRLLGYSSDEMKGTDILSHVSIHQQHAVHDVVLSRISSGSMKTVEFDVVTKEGNARTVLSKGVPIQFHNLPAILTILVDITDRKEIEDELRRKNEEINHYFSISLDLLCIADTNGKFIKLNPEWEKSLGYTLSDLEGHRFLDFVHPDDLQATLDAVSDLINKNKVINFTNRYRHKDGSIRYIEWRSSPNPDNNLIYAAARDITERRLYEEKLIRISTLKERLLSTSDLEGRLLLVSNAVVDIFDADFAGIWLINNGDICESGCKHAGAGPEVCPDRTRCLHLMARSSREITPDGICQRVPLGYVTIGKIVVGDELSIITNDLSPDSGFCDPAWIVSSGFTSFAGFRLLSPDNEATGVLAIFKKTPISQVDQDLLQDLINTLSHAINAAIASQELIESEAKFKGLFEGANDAIVIMDRSIIIDCNTKTEEMLGVPRDAIIGHSPADFAPEQQEDNYPSARRVAESIETVLNGETQRIDWAHKNRDNSLSYTEVSLSRITIHGRPYLLGIIRDITERKAAERALRKARDDLETKVRERTAALRESEQRLQLKLTSLLSPDSDLTELELGNILDLDVVQSLMNDFSKLTGITTAILDLNGKVISSSGWQDICLKFHRTHEETAKNCTDSDLHLSGSLKPGQCTAYKCTNNLWDVITPLYIGGKHVGNIFTGQFFYDDEVVDEALFVAQAERYGFDKDEYISALRKVPRLNKSHVTELMDFLVRFTEYVSRLSFSNLRLAQTMSEETAIMEALARSERRMADIIDHLPDATFAIDLNGEIITWNKAMEEMTGVTSRDIIGKGNYEYSLPFYGTRRPILIDWIFAPHEELEKEYTVIKHEGSLIVVEVDITMPDGRTITLWGKATPLYDNDGNKVGAIESIRDITQQKRVMVALQESEDKFRDLAEKSLTGIYLIQEGIFRYVNSKLAQIFEYEINDLIDTLGPENLVNPEDIPKLSGNTETRITGDVEALNYELRGITRSGRDIIIEVFGSRTIYKGKPAIIGSLLDITDRKIAEQELQRLNTELEQRVIERTAELSQTQSAYLQANKKLHLLSSITRHDIGNQLQGLLAYLDFSKDYLNDKEKIEEYINKELHIANTISRQISFTKDYESMGIEAPTWQSVHSIMKKSSLQLRHDGISITAEEPEVEMYADPLLQKVFYNLIDNALRYGGEKMTSIRVSSHPDRENLIIVIEDDGEGISVEDKLKLFSKGFGKHTGLGLFLSREILSITGLSITENGEFGKGARFEITVPKGMFRIL